MIERLKKAKPIELQIWMLSAFVFGIGLGVLLSGYLQRYALPIILIPLFVHLWMMYRIYLKK